MEGKCLLRDTQPARATENVSFALSDAFDSQFSSRRSRPLRWGENDGRGSIQSLRGAGRTHENPFSARNHFDANVICQMADGSPRFSLHSILSSS